MIIYLTEIEKEKKSKKMLGMENSWMRHQESLDSLNGDLELKKVITWNRI